MEPEVHDFRPQQKPISKELQATLAKTEAALHEMWKREKLEAQTVYEITIPAQTLKVFGKEHFEQALRQLKELRVSGTYRITKGGADGGNRA